MPTLTNQDVGFPLLLGSATVAGDKVTVVGGGNDIWGTADNFHYAWFEVSGDFDYVVKVEDLQGPDTWTKAELMARASLDPTFPEGGDPFVATITTRSAGQNEIRPQWRLTRGGSAAGETPAPVQRPTYPDTWLRLRREANTFYFLSSSNRVDWRQYSPLEVASDQFPADLLLGLAVTAHNDSDATGGIGVFSGLAEWVPVPVAIDSGPSGATLRENSTLTLQVTATGDPLKFQWRKDGVDIPGATAATYQVDVATSDDSGVYTVHVYGPVNELMSQEAVVTVTQDSVPPALVSARASEAFVEVTVVYDEPVGSSAEVAANYQVNNGVSVSSVTRLDLSTVRLAVSRMAEGTDYTLTVNNVQDLSGNAIAPGTTATFKSFVLAKGWVSFERWNTNTGSAAGLVGFVSAQVGVDGQPATGPRIPDQQRMLTRMESGRALGDNYTARMATLFMPAQTGSYIFFLSSDDHSYLYLSPDDDPAHKVRIAAEPSYNGERQWLALDRRTDPENRSDYWFSTEWPEGNYITLQAGRKYVLEGWWRDGTGGDGMEVTFILEGEADPANGTVSRLTGDLIGTFVDITDASITFTTPPADATAGENRTATFSVEVDASSDSLGYQWLRNGSPITGANSASYTTPLLSLADNGARFSVRVSIPGYEALSTEATLSVVSDPDAPVALSAGNLAGASTVGVRFNERLDAATATTAGNYTVTGVTVTEATLVGDQANVVLLTLSAPPAAGYSVTVRNVKDQAGNPVAATTLSGEVSALMNQDVGTAGVDPALEGYSAAAGGGGFVVAGGGSDIWNAADACQFLYTEFTGPLDMRVRVQSLAGPNTWTKAALMVRETLEPGSRHADVLTTQTTGQNLYNMQWRDTTDGTSASKAAAERKVGVLYPNAWIRLVREDATRNEFRGYWSEDGQAWNLYHTYTIPGDPIPEKVYAGIAVTSHDNASPDLGIGVFQDFSIREYQEMVDPQLAITASGGNIVVSWQAGTLEAAPTVLGPYAPVAGATSPYPVTPSGAAQFFQVRTQ